MANRRYTPDEIARIKEAIDLVSLIARDVELKKRGRSFVGLCPFHQEKSGSFNVVPDKHFYHCFGCGAHGDALSWLKDYCQLDFRSALERAVQLSGLGL